MLLLDTNVVSELMRPNAAAPVLTWMARQPAEAMMVSVITVMEIRYGLARLPFGARRAAMEARFEQFLKVGFAGKILPFEEGAATVAAEIQALRDQIGRPIEIEDCMIAATGRMVGAAIVTRDEKGFASCGVLVINPWTA